MTYEPSMKEHGDLPLGKDTKANMCWIFQVHLLKAERHEAVLLQDHRLLFSDDADAPEWVTMSHTNIASHPQAPCPTALETGLELLQIPAWG